MTSAEVSAADRAALARSLAPLLARLGAELTQDPGGDTVPVPWGAGVAWHVRLPAAQEAGEAEGTDLSGGLARLIATVEAELGGPLASRSRAEKQHAVRLLEERGAFEMRRSAETVAEALGLTRFTVYNYLNRIRDSADEGARP